MPSLDFPSISPADIDIRVAQVSDTYVDLLLYKNARVDMRMLDAVVGATNWQRSHNIVDGVNYCTVSIWDEEKQTWVSKQDCGTGGDFEKDKGSASDAFKRACFNWGIGRELYTVPNIRVWHSENLITIREGRNGKKTTYDTFKVTRLEVKDHVVTDIEVTNTSLNKVVYSMHSEATERPATTRKAQKVDVDKNKAVLRLKKAVEDYCARTGGDVAKVTAGIKKRPDYEETADYLNMVAAEFEGGM